MRPIKYKKLKLGKLIRPSKTKRAGSNDYPVLSMTSRSGIIKQSERFKKSIASVDKSNYKVVERNQLVIGFPMDEGVYYIQNSVDRGIMSPAYGVWDVDQKVVLPKYLEQYLHGPKALEYFKQKLRGTTARRRVVPTEQMLDLEIQVPEIEIQKAEINILILLDNLVRELLEYKNKLDELVKSRFIEMFGDVKTNSKKLPTKPFKDVVLLQRGFDLPVKQRDLNGNIPVYGSNGILSRHDVSKVDYPTVITGRSGTIGQTFFALEPCWPLNTTLFGVETYGNNVIYLKYLLDNFDLTRFYNGTGVPTLNRNTFMHELVIDASIELQNQFAEFVIVIDKSKLAIQQSIDQLETLKKKLMQEYFG